MSELKIKKIETTGIKAQQVGELMAASGVQHNRVGHVNWSEYPYAPEVEFAVAHNGRELLIDFRVCEQSVRAEFGADNADVWNDSCVEFFVQFDGESNYYNLECNCVGALLIGVGETREGRQRAAEELTSKVDRWASLGSEAFGLIDEPRCWQVSLVVPVEVFTRSKISTLDGARLRANFYKCGDGLPVAHFVSWAPIAIEKPDFHRPDFFGSLVCEDNS